MKKRKRLLVLVILICAVSTGISVAYSASLGERDKRMIKIAYMNGFLDAMKIDMGTLQAVKNDEHLLRVNVELAASRYLDTVSGLN